MAEEKRKERSEMTHSERIADHYRILCQDNPFAGIHSGQARARKSGGGLGSKKAAARYERTSAEDRAKANSDGRFGYFDEVNKRYVPFYIDMQDGGGRDTRGDKFKGGMFSELLNDLGVDPYGSQRDRTFVNPNTSPIVQAVSGISDSDRMSASMAEQARQRGLSQDATDPRMGMTQMSSMTMGVNPMQPQAMQRASAAQAHQARMAGLMQEAQAVSLEYLNTDFNNLSEHMKSKVLNMVKSGI